MSPQLRRPFWKGRRVLLTGHTGFKGTWASMWLKRAGAEVTGLALAPDTEPSMFVLTGAARDVDHRLLDLREHEAVTAAVANSKPELVIHLAAQAILRRGVRAPVETFASNVLGTVHLLEALRITPDLRAILVVTTDKVYEAAGQDRPFTEADRIGGCDPYSASKAAVEMVVSAFRETYFSRHGIALATARAGNVIGGGDFGEDRLIPDLVRAQMKNEVLRLRNPEATRPWQHVLDCLLGYFLYAEALVLRHDVPAALNFGPPPDAEAPVRSLADALLSEMGTGGGWRTEHDGDGIREAQRLNLDSSAARRWLGWSDRLHGSAAIRWTADWYRAHAAREDMRAFTFAQIDAYERLRIAHRGSSERPRPETRT